MTCCTPLLQRLVSPHNLMLLPPSYMSTVPLSPEEHQNSRVLQPKTSNISAQQAGMYGMAFAGSAVSPKLQIQPLNSRVSPAQTPTSLSDTAFELHSSQHFADVTSSAAGRVSEYAQLAHCLSIPGQIDLHDHGTLDGSTPEGAQAISTPRQVHNQDRVGGSEQSVIDASTDSHLPGMAPLGDGNGAAGCVNDQLANVTEASRPTNSEGHGLRPPAAASALQGQPPQPPITSTCLTSLVSPSPSLSGSGLSHSIWPRRCRQLCLRSC